MENTSYRKLKQNTTTDEITQIPSREKFDELLAEKAQLAKKLKALEPKLEKLAKMRTKKRNVEENLAALRREKSEWEQSNLELMVTNFIFYLIYCIFVFKILFFLTLLLPLNHNINTSSLVIFLFFI
jgi:uncharacterized membrane protein (DUF106 family)